MAYRPFIPRDYKLFRHERPRRQATFRWLWLASLLLLSLAVVMIWPGEPTPADDDETKQSSVSRTLALPGHGPSDGDPGLVQSDATARDTATPTGADSAKARVADGAPAPEPAGDGPAFEWKTLKVRPGDTLAAIFGRHGLGPATVHNVVYHDSRTARLRDLKPGEELHLALDGDGDLAALRFELDEASLGEIVASGDGLESREIKRPIETRVVRTSGSIDASLYLAGKQAGLSDPLVMELARIFAWDIDFVYDIRAGDSFHLIYEELYRDGEKLRDGRILAATFVNRGEPLTAVRYDTGDGNPEYYTPEGRNMRKEFLRTPVDFRRISSRFDPNRLHPSLGYRRPHEGVDYAANTGTPVIATGNGRVERASWYGGYGNCIIIEHAGRFQTLYAHLSKYARGVRSGARVKQGQIIGYVGMTGTATGPHLHYEFHVDGRVRDPLNVEFPPAPSLPDSEMATFRQVSRPLVAQLDSMSRNTMLASARD